MNEPSYFELSSLVATSAIGIGGLMFLTLEAVEWVKEKRKKLFRQCYRKWMYPTELCDHIKGRKL